MRRASQCGPPPFPHCEAPAIRMATGRVERQDTRFSHWSLGPDTRPGQHDGALPARVTTEVTAMAKVFVVGDVKAFGAISGALRSAGLSSVGVEFVVEVPPAPPAALDAN